MSGSRIGEAANSSVTRTPNRSAEPANSSVTGTPNRSAEPANSSVTRTPNRSAERGRTEGHGQSMLGWDKALLKGKR